MRYLTLGEVVELHRLILSATGGASGIRDLGALESAIAQPKATFGAADLYPTLIEKAAALCFALVEGHRLSMATSALGTLPWKPSWSSTVPRSLPLWMNKSASCSISQPAGSVAAY